jgi:hypothetical protein
MHVAHDTAHRSQKQASQAAAAASHQQEQEEGGPSSIMAPQPPPPTPPPAAPCLSLPLGLAACHSGLRRLLGGAPACS